MPKINFEEKLEKQRRKVLRDAIWKLTKHIPIFHLYDLMEEMPTFNSEKGLKIKNKCDKKLAKINPKQDKKKKVIPLPNDAHHTS